MGRFPNRRLVVEENSTSSGKFVGFFFLFLYFSVLEKQDAPSSVGKCHIWLSSGSGVSNASISGAAAAAFKRVDVITEIPHSWVQ